MGDGDAIVMLFMMEGESRGVEESRSGGYLVRLSEPNTNRSPPMGNLLLSISRKGI